MTHSTPPDAPEVLITWEWVTSRIVFWFSGSQKVKDLIEAPVAKTEVIIDGFTRLIQSILKEVGLDTVLKDGYFSINYAKNIFSLSQSFREEVLSKLSWAKREQIIELISEGMKEHWWYMK